MRRLAVQLVLAGLVASGLCVVGVLWAVDGSKTEAASPRIDAAQRRAASVVAALAADGLPVADPVICRAPSPSSPKPPASVAFRDTTVKQTYPRPLVAAGGVVEVFASEEALRDRVARLERQTHRAQEYGFDEGGRVMHAERRFIAGTVLLRVSGFVSGPAARDYARTFRDVATTTSSTDHHTLRESPCST